MKALAGNILDLQRDVLELTDSAAALLRRAAVPLREEARYLSSAAQVEAERLKVAELELRMAIVAPMKAGKSTILNAVIGEELLPSRNTAMTSLPTSIVFDAGVEESVLEIESGVVNLLGEAWNELTGAVRHESLENALKRVGDPALEPLVRAVNVGEPLGLEARTTGSVAIEGALSRLNDLMRLWSVFKPSDGLARNTQKINLPQLRVPSRGTTPNSGRLVIVDTPGPNDRNLHPCLQELAARQIRDTSLVLVVLDYTQLNSEAADQHREGIQQIAAIRSTDSLFVLVNKIDQRTSKKDLQSEGVLHFVASQLGLQSAADQKRVFEISARKALRASVFRRQWVDDDETCRKLEPAQAIAQEYRPNDWEEALQESTSEDLRNWAEKLWRKSGFNAFLSHALESLLAEAGPRSIQSAVIVTRAHLKQLRDDAQIRRRNLDKEEGEIKAQVQRIDEELQEIEERRKALAGVLKRERDNLQRFVSLGNELQAWTSTTIRKFFQDRERLKAWLKRSAKSLPSSLKLLLSELKFLLFESHTDEIEHRFELEEEARAFADQAIDYALSQTQPALDQAAVLLNQQVSRAQKTLEMEIRKATGPVLERAKERLKKAFDVELEISDVDLSNSLGDVEVSPSIVFVKGRVEESAGHERRWYTLWLWKHEITYTVQHPDQYVVSLRVLEGQVDAAITAKLDALRKEFVAFLDKEFTPKVDGYFKHLSGYLGVYRENIAKSLEDSRRSLDERKETREMLDRLHKESTEMLSLAEFLIQATTQVKP
jgi:GTPase Era involved in 16S rRNA processing